jgi:uncharacterized protein (TIGR03435 family)
MDAYSVRRYQISGLPDWGDSGHDVYDIAATIEGDRAPTPTQVRQMLQTLLADRFQLKLHKETRELPFFALVPAKSGLKLTLVPQEDGKPLVLTCGGSGGEGPSVETVAFHRSWERMPELLSLNSDRPVIDKTGLKGLYCTRDGQDPAMAVMSSLGNSSRGRGGPNPNADDPASIFTVLEQKLGLRLEPQKGPLEILVIDHVARPTVN